MRIAGIGLVFARGRGIGSFEAALRKGWTAPRRRKATCPAEKEMPVYYVGEDTIADKAVLKNMRRADRFSRMATLAAWDAVLDSGIGVRDENTQLGVILATALGPQATAFRFLDDIIDYGNSKVSPTLFSHSVHNAAASYIASALDNRGPTLTVTDFAFSFQQALALAWCWLEERRCANVLVGTVEECGKAMEDICRTKLRIAEDGRIRSFDFSVSPAAVPGEGSAFLMLTGDNTTRGYCDIRGVRFEDEVGAQRPDLYILDTDGMSADERPYIQLASTGVRLAGYSPIFGSMMTGSAFHCVAGALTLRNETEYGCPVQDNPHGVRLCTATRRRRLETVHCVKYDCRQGKAVIELQR